VLDVATGDIYVSTDFSVYRLVSGTQTWIPAADGLPTAAISGLTLVGGQEAPRRANRGVLFGGQTRTTACSMPRRTAAVPTG